MIEDKATSTIEEYLEAIYNMRADGTEPMAARLAERLSVSIPTVMAALRRMERDGLVTLGARREISLTERGERLATTLLRRHRLAERLLTDVLKVPWHESHAEACLLEHAISARVERHLDEALGHPERCPHGSPIPGNCSVIPHTIQLREAESGVKLVVDRISEMAERQTEFLAYLSEHHLHPGQQLHVERVDSFAGTLVLRVGDDQLVLGLPAARHIWVRPGADEGGR